MAEREKRKRGRPPASPEKRKRNNVTIRMRDRLKRDLERTAASHGYSLSEEIERRLEHSFEGGWIVDEILASRDRTDLAIRIFDTIASAESGKTRWYEDQATYDRVVKEIAGTVLPDMRNRAADKDGRGE